MSDVPPIAAEPVAAAPGDRRRLLIDLASSYALSAARVVSMAALLAIMFRYTTAGYAAVFILVRTMLGLIVNLSSGLAPATLRELTMARAGAVPIAMPAFADAADGAALAYRDALPLATPGPSPEAQAYASGVTVAGWAAVALGVIVAVYAGAVDELHGDALTHGWHVGVFAALYAFGLLARLASEPASAVIQSRGLLRLDNAFLIAAELAVPAVVLLAAAATPRHATLLAYVGLIHFACNAAAAFARTIAARHLLSVLGLDRIEGRVDREQVVRVTRGSAGIAAGSLADFLYAPTNVLIISACISTAAVADYTPALQFDAALLLLVGAIAATILPRAMRLAGDGRRDALRALYVRSTLVSLAILAAAAVAVWIASPTILRLWLGQPMPVTLSVLPLVLVHTVFGGTAGVGRAVLLAMGRFRAYTISAVIGGVANVALALLFVVGFGWGLRGVALATIVAVVARCAIWMPWYVLRATRAGPTEG